MDGSYDIPINIAQYVDNLTPAYRLRLYKKYSRIRSILPAVINFFPIPFLGTIILGDTFGGNLVGGAALLVCIAVPGAAS
jgi:hypothetical protein